MIYLYNTLTRQKEPFMPIKKGKVSLYSCGPTVYDYPQIGNWTAYIRWDTLVRLLDYEGYKVTRVMNITDVGHLVSDADDGEDKLEKGAKREGKSAWDIAQFYTQDFINSMESLNLVMPSRITKATDYINQQIELIKTLESKGYTYIIKDGVYFDASKYDKYADFAKLDLKSLKEGARVVVNSEKRNSYDFALWKFTPKDIKRDMEWDSPWGKGFPGWHLECSAMILSELGETIDIHTGGIDHIPVHHTNEIAQSFCATGKPLANYWLHNNFLTVNGEKAAKSLGNAFTLHDLVGKGYSPLDFRMFILQSHYRTASNFTWENLDSAKNRLEHWREVADLIWQPVISNSSDVRFDDKQIIEAIVNDLKNDMDTPGALAKIDIFISTLQDGLINTEIKTVARVFHIIDQLLGLKLVGKDITSSQKEILKKRQTARDSKLWQQSDLLRDTLADEGIGVRDTANGQFWYRASYFK